MGPETVSFLTLWFVVLLCADHSMKLIHRYTRLGILTSLIITVIVLSGLGYVGYVFYPLLIL